MEECGFDGGDCCGTNVDLGYDCNYWNEQNCECKANNSFHEYWLKTHGACNECLFSDGECNDINNNNECEFDGGDCHFIQGEFQIIHTFSSTIFFQDHCEYPEKWKDGICDDANNNEACGFDGEDCCTGDTSQCEICMCHILGNFCLVPILNPNFYSRPFLDGSNDRYVLNVLLYANGSLGDSHYGAIVTQSYPDQLGVVYAGHMTLQIVRHIVFNYKKCTSFWLGSCCVQNHGIHKWSS